MFRMILSKRKKILLFLVFGIILSSFLFYEDSISGSITGFTVLSSKETKTDFCENIENDFIRDVCYFTKRDDCYSIENSYLQYVCLRTMFREHLPGLLTNKHSTIKDDFNSILDECEDFNKYNNLHCIYVNVASLAKDNLSEAKHICNQLEDEHLNGECKFYIASSFAMNIDKDTSKKIDLITNLCEEITHPSWRSECYYVLADELVMTKPEYLEEIANACRKSNLAVEYACFNHITFLLSEEKAIEFCNLPKSIKEKAECFMGVSYTLGWRYGNFSLGVSTCNKVPNEFMNYCFEGLSEGTGRHFSNNVSSGISACNKTPIEFRNDCFFELAKSFGRYFSRNVSSGISTCNKFPVEFKNGCFRGLSIGVGWHFDGNISSAISACNKIPTEFREECFLRVGEEIGIYFSHNISSTIPSCNQFPIEFKSDCFMGLSKGISQYFNNNVSADISTCNKFPTEFRNDCFFELGRGIWRFDKDIYSAISACNNFPIEFKDNCFLGISEGIGRHFRYNISSGISACNEIPTGSKSDCFNGLREI